MLVNELLQQKKFLCWLTAVLLWLCVFGMAGAAELLPIDDDSTQREKFEALEKAIRHTPGSRLASLDAEFEALQNYSLYPYLVRQRLYRDLTIKHRDQVEAFLAQFDGQPFTYGLRSSWLRYLAQNKQQSAFLASYRDGMDSEITCYYLQYQLQDATDPNYWLSKVEKLWLSGQSQPDACDPIFKQWEAAGMLTTELVLARLQKAATSGNPKLIPYLQRKLPASHQYIADLWKAVLNNPRTVLRQTAFPLRYPNYEARIMTYGLNRLAWQRPDEAAKGYYLWAPKGVFNPHQINALHRAIALSLAIDNQPNALEWLERADVKEADEDVKRWHMAYLLRARDWQGVLNVIETASPARQNEDNFMYWRARAYEALGVPEQAAPLYERLSGERHYYGFMASAKAGKKPEILHTPTPRDQLAMEQIEALPAAQRAYEFLQMGRLIDARREWRYLITHLDSASIKDAALLASEWGWYDQAIISFTQSGYMDDIDKRFPLAYATQFSSIGQTYNIQPAFAMAIARRESSFMVDAVSPAGATGLMQLMPGTAHYLAAKKLNRNVLFEPDQNVQLGVQYLRYLMDKLNNNPVLVSASYNAGWRRVLEWLPESNSLPTDIWIENIPYRETRHYVKAVLAYRYIYEHQLGTPSELFPQLATTDIPSAEALSNAQGNSTVQLAPK
ncbi:transglycosylase SLT domain-containing protein [Alteromonas pelagimontana]|uniref:Transglycosylase SLT domain-containing protein n=2 Tax=Alteromonas pelagimontana TaxID=1858656 RepID=A0A6M4MJD7_9ALTE|nr:transglycosylase SLT domain-containing protein [Alteromonas pelagimontana]